MQMCMMVVAASLERAHRLLTNILSSTMFRISSAQWRPFLGWLALHPSKVIPPFPRRCHDDSIDRIDETVNSSIIKV